MALTTDYLDLVDGGEAYGEAFAAGLRPAPNLLIGQWADQYRELSKISSSEDGRYRTARTPFLAEIMECLSPASPVRKVVFRKPAQIGGTEVGNNWCGYVVDCVGGAMLIVQPTVEMAKRWSRQRLAPMLRDTEKLAGKVRDARSRDSGNTMLSKEFDGGILIITGANSAIGLRSMPAAWLFFDEVDAYPDNVDDEGHPIELAERRATTFPFSKVFEASTPKVRHASRIDADFEASDQAYYYVPCPECGGFQTLDDDRLLYDERSPELCTEIACVHCGSPIPEGKKTAFLEAGQWWRRLDGENWGPRPPDPVRAAGFHLNGLYSPIGWLSWGEIAVEREAAKSDESRQRTYTNTILGLSYEEQSDAPDWEKLYQQRETYQQGTVPSGAYLLTAGVDIQRNRIEIAWYGWGPGFEGWCVDHDVLEGDTAHDDVWDLLTTAAGRRFPHVDGGQALPADVVLVDMQYASEAVKQWVTARKEPRRIRAIQGIDAWGSPAIAGRSETDLTIGTGKKIRNGFAFWKVAVSSVKLELYRRLRREFPDDRVPPYGGPWMHYPQMAEEWFKQLTAERLARKAGRNVRQRSRLEWTTTRDRNEALDLTVYNMAGAYMLKVDQFDDRVWANWRARWGGAGAAPAKSRGPRTLSEGVRL